jgi:hypothetical protein
VPIPATGKQKLALLGVIAECGRDACAVVGAEPFHPIRAEGQHSLNIRSERVGIAQVAAGNDGDTAGIMDKASIVSSSIMEINLIPLEAASCTTSSGDCVPLEHQVWMCRSAFIVMLPQ